MGPEGKTLEERVDQNSNDIESIYGLITSVEKTVKRTERRVDHLAAVQAEHTATLAEHTATLAEHSAILNEHSATLDSHGGKLDEILELLRAR